MLRLALLLLAFQGPTYDPSIAPSHYSASPNKSTNAFLRWRVAGTYSLRIQSPASQDFHLDYACGYPLIWSPSGTRLLAHRATTEHVHANDCQPAIYDIPTRKRIQSFGKPGTTFALSPNQKNLAYAGATELWIQPFNPDFNLSTPAWRLAQHSLGIDELRWTPDSQRLHYKIPFDDHAAPQIIEVAPGAIPQASGPREPNVEERLPLLALDLRAEAPHPKPYRLPLPPPPSRADTTTSSAATNTPPMANGSLTAFAAATRTPASKTSTPFPPAAAHPGNSRPQTTPSWTSTGPPTPFISSPATQLTPSPAQASTRFA